MRKEKRVIVDSESGKPNRKQKKSRTTHLVPADCVENLRRKRGRDWTTPTGMRTDARNQKKMRN